MSGAQVASLLFVAFVLALPLAILIVLGFIVYAMSQSAEVEGGDSWRD
jgi:hypothetical protein